MSTNQPMEVKKDGLRQMQDGTWNLTVKVHPNDMPTSLMAAPMGTRYGMALVEIGDDEQPVQKAPEPPRERSRAEWAGIRCSDPVFRKWLYRRIGAEVSEALVRSFHGMSTTDAEITAIALRNHLNIQSRKELDSNPEKGAAWDKLDGQFIEDTRLPERH